MPRLLFLVCFLAAANFKIKRLKLQKAQILNPFALPVLGFAGAILIGTFFLSLPWASSGKDIALIDAFFIATSCVCVTGLASIDIAADFSTFGHVCMMVLMQLGGLGITTYSALFFYMLTHRVSFSDRMALSQMLLSDPNFHLGRFLQRIVLTVLSIEIVGILSLYLMEPEKIGLFKASFLGVSAFCNAGFALWSDNLVSWQQHIGVNTVVMSLISLGGIGFAVLDELHELFKKTFKNIIDCLKTGAIFKKPELSFGARLVIRTSVALTFGGALCIFLTEYFVNDTDFFYAPGLILPALFQSVTCRTAGFNSVAIGGMTDVALLVMIFLMFVGGSSGSCAGGIKTGTFRVLLGVIRANIKGENQVKVQGRAVPIDLVQKAFTLMIFVLLSIVLITFCLVILEGGNQPHGKTPIEFLDLFFEIVSAFGTVGLTTGITSSLTSGGKFLVCVTMFLGRVGPIWLISMLQQYQRAKAYKMPEIQVAVG